jgi:RHS repeat-associated protein
VKTAYVHGWDLIFQTNASVTDYYQVDGLGSTRQLTNNTGTIRVEYDYDAYGNLTNKVGDASNNYLFAGEQFDNAVDGYYLRARYYDPATGRFASTDSFEGYANQPITLNDYLYGNNNPAIFIDPSGRIAAIEYASLLSEFVVGKTDSAIGAFIGFVHGFSNANLLFIGNILEIASSGGDVIEQWGKAIDKTEKQAKDIQTILEKTFGAIKDKGLVSGFISGAGIEVKITLEIQVGSLIITDDFIAGVGGSVKGTKKIQLRGGGYEDGYKAASLYFNSLRS